jgi:NADH:ubiquinone reductase (H+-translocating)
MGIKNSSVETGRVVVIGAGYGGLMAALRAAGHVDVTLIDPALSFTERVREHELATGRADITHPLALFLRHKRIKHLPARAIGIDTDLRHVVTDDGVRHRYERLVYALGSRTRDFGVGSDASGRVFTAENADQLRKRLDDGPGCLTVVGAGNSGIEMAAELAESEPDWHVRLVTAGPVGPALSERGRAHVRAVLAGLGVTVEENRPVGVGEIDSDVIVWTASLEANSELARSAGIALTGAGRIEVDPMLRSVSHPDVYAVGDAAAACTERAGVLRMACATALPVGSRAGRNVVAELRGAEPEPLDFRYHAQCLSLGRRDGLVQFVEADDSPKSTIVTGRLAAFIKEQVVRSTVRLLRLAAR